MGLFGEIVPPFLTILSHFGSGAGIADFSRKFSREICGKSFVSFLKNTENVEQSEIFGGFFLFAS